MAATLKPRLTSLELRLASDLAFDRFRRAAWAWRDLVEAEDSKAQSHYDPNQPRDALGKWTSEDASSARGDVLRHYQTEDGTDHIAIDHPDGLTDLPDEIVVKPNSNNNQLHLKNWPVPGHRQLNLADKPGQGDGHYGASRDRGRRKHQGIDIQAPVGTPVVAADDGRVVLSSDISKSYGDQIIIDHGYRNVSIDNNNLRLRIYSHYAHLKNRGVTAGRVVSRGTIIGSVGQTGNSPSKGDAHLHFEVRVGSPLPHSQHGTTIDPAPLLAGAE